MNKSMKQAWIGIVMFGFSIAFVVSFLSFYTIVFAAMATIWALDRLKRVTR